MSEITLEKKDVDALVGIVITAGIMGTDPDSEKRTKQLTTFCTTSALFLGRLLDKRGMPADEYTQGLEKFIEVTKAADDGKLDKMEKARQEVLLLKAELIKKSFSEESLLPGLDDSKSTLRLIMLIKMVTDFVGPLASIHTKVASEMPQVEDAKVPDIDDVDENWEGVNYEGREYALRGMVLPAATFTTVGSTPCSHCNTELDLNRVVSPDGESVVYAPPEEGQIVICGVCGKINIMKEDNNFEEATEESLAEIPPRERELIEFTAAEVKKGQGL